MCRAANPLLSIEESEQFSNLRRGHPSIATATDSISPSSSPNRPQYSLLGFAHYCHRLSAWNPGAARLLSQHLFVCQRRTTMRRTGELITLPALTFDKIN